VSHMYINIVVIRGKLKNIAKASVYVPADLN